MGSSTWARCYLPRTISVLCLFQGHSRAAVIRAGDRLGLPRERLMDSLWIGPASFATEGNLE